MTKIVFFADDGTHGRELWVTDGSVGNTSMVIDIMPGAGSTVLSPTFITSLGDGRGIFQANDGTHGAELWITDGTPAGTSMISDINPGGAGSVPDSMRAIGNGRAIFVARDGTHNREPWITDGTQAGTFLLKDINSAGYYGGFHGSSSVNSFAPAAGGRVVFMADANPGVSAQLALWVTDTTSNGTSMLLPFQWGNGSMFSLGTGRVVFVHSDGTSGNELWVTDGTPGGTSLLKDVYPGASSGVPISNRFYPAGNGRATFIAANYLKGMELWITDGTAAGTTIVADVRPGQYGSFPKEVAYIGNGRLVFSADDGVHGRELWVSDGTPSGTSLLRDINTSSLTSPTGQGASDPRYITPTGDGRALFSANTTDGRQLWVTDGTTAGTTQVATIYPWYPGRSWNAGYLPEQNARAGEGGGFLGGGPGTGYRGFAPVGNGKFLFRASDGMFPDAGNSTTATMHGTPVHGNELWITDGTAAGTSLFLDISPGVHSFAYGLVTNDSRPVGWALLVPCFARGTQILTADGSKPVECIRVGDRLPTAGAGGTALRPVRWVGRSLVDLRRHPRPSEAAPFRVRAHAFADNEPARDLLLSPDHAIYIQGALIPIRLLANGATIVQEIGHHVVEYFHVELDRHDIVVAENLRVESFLDTGNRHQFLNADAPVDLHPQFAVPAGPCISCAPLLLGGEEIVRHHAALATRASLLGFMLTSEPTLEIFCDGLPLTYARGPDNVVTAIVPSGAGEVWLRSNASQPRLIDPRSDDTRLLGVAVHQVVIDGESIPLTSPLLAAGFHAVEADRQLSWRWTNGSARIEIPGHARERQIQIGMTNEWLKYWVGSPDDEIAAAAHRSLPDEGATDPALAALPPAIEAHERNGVRLLPIRHPGAVVTPGIVDCLRDDVG